LLAHVLGVVREHVLDVGPIFDVHHEVVPGIDVVMLPKVDQVDDLRAFFFLQIERDRERVCVGVCERRVSLSAPCIGMHVWL
jgi:hypothetical protein